MAASMPSKRSGFHDFDVDSYLNPIIPRPRFHHLPRPISHFFGYRPPIKDSSSIGPSASHPSTPLIWFFSFLGAFIGISIIENVYRALPDLDGHAVPLIIASFGAAAVLEYNTVESPLSQPRNLFFGHILSAFIGVGITKLFHLLPQSQFEDLRWLAGALSVGIASAVMGMTKTIHPPAGATALLAATSSEITVLGWWLPALVALGATLMLTSALLVNNLYCRFPIYWWTPVDLTKVRDKDDIVRVSDAEKGEPSTSTHFASESDADVDANFNRTPHDRHLHPTRSIETTHSTAPTITNSIHATDDLAATSPTIPTPTPAPPPTSRHSIRKAPEKQTTESQILITPDKIVIPDWMEPTEWEREVLEIFRGKIEERMRGTE